MPEFRPNAQFVLQLKRASASFACFTILIAILAWVGWMIGVPILASVVSGWPTMKPFTASCFLLGAVSFLLYCRSLIGNPGLRVSGIVLLLLGVSGVSDAITGWMDQLAPDNPVFQTIFQSMSLGTAIVVALLGTSYVALANGATRLAQCLAVVMVFSGLSCVIGVSYGLDLFSRTILFSTMSLNTGVAALSLGFAVLFLRPEKGLTRIFVLDVAGAVLRRSLPFVIGLPILIGWICLKGERLGLYSTAEGVALFVVAMILTFTLVATDIARHLQRVDVARRRAVHVIETKDNELRQEHARLLQAREQLADQNRRLEELVSQRTQRLQAIVRSLETVVYTIAHDLRAPLRAMQGFTNALHEEYGQRLDETAQNYCDRIAMASHRMDVLLSDLLEYAQLSHLDPPLTLVDLNAEIDSVLSELREPIESHEAEVTVDKPLPRVCAEPKILERVIVNLVTNALKFTAATVTPKVHIYAQSLAGKVRIWVEDNGIGIAPEHQQQIFQVFQRLHTADQYPGTGIGLAIVQKAIEQMRGQVGVESQSGKGSRFWIELPAERCRHA